MAKEVEKKIPEMGNVTLDDSVEELPMREIPKRVTAKRRTVETPTYDDSPELINCLRNEKVIVRYLKRPTSMVSDPKHVLYGGMSENATRSFVVPRLNSTGTFKNVLTNSEKAFLEHVMGLEYDALSIYKRENNFWDDSNPMGIGRVTLRKQDNVFDLSVPEDYIKVKVLMANKDYIARSLQELEDRPKATYQFVIISENAESSANLNKMNLTMKCYMEYGKVETDFYTLRVIVELFEGRALSSKIKLDYLQGKINEYIQRDPRRFYATIKDEYLPAKVLIKRCVDAGLIGKKNDAYYLKDDGSPLCEINEESTLNTAARFISSIKHQELKYSLEARLKE